MILDLKDGRFKNPGKQAEGKTLHNLHILWHGTQDLRNIDHIEKVDGLWLK